ncbi:MAG: Flp family type IVb pilin [bacterium]|nr:Flp family type IVb pilin [bacterium]
MLRRKKGQGMTEYILIVALIALVAVASIQLFGEKIKERFSTLADTISG